MINLKCRFDLSSSGGRLDRIWRLRFQLLFKLFQKLPAEEATAVAVTESGAHCVIPLEVPIGDRDAREFLGAVAAVLIA